eukprot:TRINITY_DN34353_c0_g1_i1.p1 TRINITY_DN34353_c0_g1~~TRINITY_DN34353_c0_g1_i1.p1  ORF type:complete len:259 (+),score=21.76 TRINITY_DN34353_c0_g1_i1:34-810(+)
MKKIPKEWFRSKHHFTNERGIIRKNWVPTRFRPTDVPHKGVLKGSLFGADFIIGKSRAGDTVAYENSCPHQGLKVAPETAPPNAKGVTLCGEGWIKCPFHGWQFDLTSGAPYKNKGKHPLRSLGLASSSSDNGLLLICEPSAETTTPALPVLPDVSASISSHFAHCNWKLVVHVLLKRVDASVCYPNIVVLSSRSSVVVVPLGPASCSVHEFSDGAEPPVCNDLILQECLRMQNESTAGVTLSPATEGFYDRVRMDML